MCRELYNEFGKKNNGYSETDIISLCEKLAGTSLKDFFEKYVYGTEDFQKPLLECFSYMDIELIQTPSALMSESAYGFKHLILGITEKYPWSLHILRHGKQD